MEWNKDLTGNALRIAAATESPLRVMAGPGTGKSFALKRRVARLLEEGVPGREILAVTFTRTAADALVKDIRSLGIRGADQIVASTLHSLCFSLLTRNGVFDVLGRVPRPLQTYSESGILKYEAEPMLYDVMAEGTFGRGRECTKRIRAFEAAWARLQSDDPGWPMELLDKQFHTELISWLTFHRAMLIGELIPVTLNFLRGNPAFRPNFRHILVDEYQDLNRAEQALIDVLSSTVPDISIVGDVDQSIYSFRHANPEGIIDYTSDHPTTLDENLIECRRCPLRVVTLADSLIRHNHPSLTQPRLLPRSGNPEGGVGIIQWQGLSEEAEGIAEFVKHVIDSGIAEPGEVLILSPRRQIGYGLRDALEMHSVPVHSFYSEEALASDFSKYAIAVLSLIVDPEDRVALRWLLGRGDPACRAAQYSQLQHFCEQNNISPMQAMTDILAKPSLLPDIEDLLLEFSSLKQLLTSLSSASSEEIVRKLIPPDKDETKLLHEIIIAGRQEAETPRSLLDRIREELSQPAIPERDDKVRIMSLQKSKGLTAKVVIVTTCNQAFLPIVVGDTLIEKRLALEEQRRLFYVAITRCTDSLVLSSISRLPRALAHKLGALLPRGRGAVANSHATQFISELGPTKPDTISGDGWAASGYRL